MTLEQVSALSDVELNRAMIWLYSGLTIFKDTGKSIDVMHVLKNGEYHQGPISYINQCNMAMPLAVENGLSIIFEGGECWAGTDITAGDGPCIYMENDATSKNPFRAICEVLVLIKHQ